MDITLVDALALAGIVALLMLNYSNRRVATAKAVRLLNKDHLKGTFHHKTDKTLVVLRRRLSLESGMLILSALAGLVAFLSAASVVFEWDSLAKIAFVAGLAGAFVSLLLSLYESVVANQSHFDELDHTISKNDPYYKTVAP